MNIKEDGTAGCPFQGRMAVFGIINDWRNSSILTTITDQSRRK
jgi:hypothetical protein